MSQTANGTLHIGISNCHDWYDKLKFEHARLVTSQYKEKYDILNFLITALHLSDDWLSKDSETRPRLANTKRGAAPKDDLANGNKHFVLANKNSEKRVVEGVHSSTYESSYYSYCFGPHYGVRIGLSFYTIPVLADSVMAYFDWIFDDSIPSDEFPETLRETIVRAGMPDRVRITHS